MSYANKLHDAMLRGKEVGKWKMRLKKLKKRTGQSVNKFCDKHDLDPSQLSRHANGRMNAEWDTIRKVNAALEAEGV